MTLLMGSMTLNVAPECIGMANKSFMSLALDALKGTNSTSVRGLMDFNKQIEKSMSASIR